MEKRSRNTLIIIIIITLYPNVSSKYNYSTVIISELIADWRVWVGRGADQSVDGGSWPVTGRLIVMGNTLRSAFSGSGLLQPKRINTLDFF